MTARGRTRDRIKIKFMRLPNGAGLPLPQYQTAQSAGMDIVAAIGDAEPLTLKPGARAIVPTGFAIALPAGTEAQIRPRSGLAAKHGVTVLNSPGTIDADYRGEVGVILVNFGSEPFTIRRGDRIAQMVIGRVVEANLSEVASLEATVRGSGGYGSTGLRSATEKPKPARKSKTVLSKSDTTKGLNPKAPKSKKR